MIYNSNSLSKRKALIILLFLSISGLFLSCATAKYPYGETRLPIEEIENPLVFPVKSTVDEYEVLILGDIHGYDFNRLVNDTDAWLKYREKKTKAFDSSFEYTTQVLKEAAESDIDYVIVPGDFTVDGEKASHKMFASILSDFRAKTGKQVYIVPGNHDVNNPRARQFLKKRPKYAPTVKEKEYIEIYSSFGYSEAYSRDSTSLSYAVEPKPGLVFLCIDTNKYQYNIYFPFFRSSIPGSGLKKSTTDWIKETLSRAQKSGKTVIVIHHHPLYEPVFKPRTTVPYSEKIRDLYRHYGVSFVISAHRHRYYVNSTDAVPQVTAPNLSSGTANALKASVSNGSLTLTLDPFGYSE